MHVIGMYVCIDIKSLPHIAWRLQLGSESWGITNKLNAGKIRDTQLQ